MADGTGILTKTNGAGLKAYLARDAASRPLWWRTADGKGASRERDLAPGTEKPLTAETVSKWANVYVVLPENLPKGGLSTEDFKTLLTELTGIAGLPKDVANNVRSLIKNHAAGETLAHNAQLNEQSGVPKDDKTEKTLKRAANAVIGAGTTGAVGPQVIDPAVKARHILERDSFIERYLKSADSTITPQEQQMLDRRISPPTAAGAPPQVPATAPRGWMVPSRQSHETRVVTTPLGGYSTEQVMKMAQGTPTSFSAAEGPRHPDVTDPSTLDPGSQEFTAVRQRWSEELGYHEERLRFIRKRDSNGDYWTLAEHQTPAEMRREVKLGVPPGTHVKVPLPEGRATYLPSTPASTDQSSSAATNMERAVTQVQKTLDAVGKAESAYRSVSNPINAQNAAMRRLQVHNIGQDQVDAEGRKIHVSPVVGPEAATTLAALVNETAVQGQGGRALRGAARPLEDTALAARPFDEQSGQVLRQIGKSFEEHTQDVLGRATGMNLPELQERLVEQFGFGRPGQDVEEPDTEEEPEQEGPNPVHDFVPGLPILYRLHDANIRRPGGKFGGIHSFVQQIPRVDADGNLLRDDSGEVISDTVEIRPPKLESVAAIPGMYGVFNGATHSDLEGNALPVTIVPDPNDANLEGVAAFGAHVAPLNAGIAEHNIAVSQARRELKNAISTHKTALRAAMKLSETQGEPGTVSAKDAEKVGLQHPDSVPQPELLEGHTELTPEQKEEWEKQKAEVRAIRDAYIDERGFYRGPTITKRNGAKVPLSEYFKETLAGPVDRLGGPRKSDYDPETGRQLRQSPVGSEYSDVSELSDVVPLQTPEEAVAAERAAGSEAEAARLAQAAAGVASDKDAARFDAEEESRQAQLSSVYRLGLEHPMAAPVNVRQQQGVSVATRWSAPDARRNEAPVNVAMAPGYGGDTPVPGMFGETGMMQYFPGPGGYSQIPEGEEERKRPDPVQQRQKEIAEKAAKEAAAQKKKDDQKDKRNASRRKRRSIEKIVAQYLADPDKSKDKSLDEIRAMAAADYDEQESQRDIMAQKEADILSRWQGSEREEGELDRRTDVGLLFGGGEGYKLKTDFTQRPDSSPLNVSAFADSLEGVPRTGYSSVSLTDTGSRFDLKNTLPKLGTAIGEKSQELQAIEDLKNGVESPARAALVRFAVRKRIAQSIHAEASEILQAAAAGQYEPDAPKVQRAKSAKQQAEAQLEALERSRAEFESKKRGPYAAVDVHIPVSHEGRGDGEYSYNPDVSGIQFEFNPERAHSVRALREAVQGAGSPQEVAERLGHTGASYEELHPVLRDVVEGVHSAQSAATGGGAARQLGEVMESPDIKSSTWVRTPGGLAGEDHPFYSKDPEHFEIALDEGAQEQKIPTVEPSGFNSMVSGEGLKDILQHKAAAQEQFSTGRAAVLKAAADELDDHRRDYAERVGDPENHEELKEEFGGTIPTELEYVRAKMLESRGGTAVSDKTIKDLQGRYDTMKAETPTAASESIQSENGRRAKRKETYDKRLAELKALQDRVSKIHGDRREAVEAVRAATGVDYSHAYGMDSDVSGPAPDLRDMPELARAAYLAGHQQRIEEHLNSALTKPEHKLLIQDMRTKAKLVDKLYSDPNATPHGQETKLKDELRRLVSNGVEPLRPEEYRAAHARAVSQVQADLNRAIAAQQRDRSSAARQVPPELQPQPVSGEEEVGDSSGLIPSPQTELSETEILDNHAAKLRETAAKIKTVARLGGLSDADSTARAEAKQTAVEQQLDTQHDLFHPGATPEEVHKFASDLVNGEGPGGTGELDAKLANRIFDPNTGKLNVGEYNREMFRRSFPAHDKRFQHLYSDTGELDTSKIRTRYSDEAKEIIDSHVYAPEEVAAPDAGSGTPETPHYEITREAIHEGLGHSVRRAQEVTEGVKAGLAKMAEGHIPPDRRPVQPAPEEDLPDISEVMPVGRGKAARRRGKGAAAEPAAVPTDTPDVAPAPSVTPRTMVEAQQATGAEPPKIPEPTVGAQILEHQRSQRGEDREPGDRPAIRVDFGTQDPHVLAQIHRQVVGELVAHAHEVLTKIMPPDKPKLDNLGQQMRDRETGEPIFEITRSRGGKSQNRQRKRQRAQLDKALANSSRRADLVGMLKNVHQTALQLGPEGYNKFVTNIESGPGAVPIMSSGSAQASDVLAARRDERDPTLVADAPLTPLDLAKAHVHDVIHTIRRQAADALAAQAASPNDRAAVLGEKKGSTVNDGGETVGNLGQAISSVRATDMAVHRFGGVPQAIERVLRGPGSPGKQNTISMGRAAARTIGQSAATWNSSVGEAGRNADVAEAARTVMQDDTVEAVPPRERSVPTLETRTVRAAVSSMPTVRNRELPQPSFSVGMTPYRPGQFGTGVENPPVVRVNPASGVNTSPQFSGAVAAPEAPATTAAAAPVVFSAPGGAAKTDEEERKA